MSTTPLNRLLQSDFVARAGGRLGTLATVWNQEADNYRLSFVSYDGNGNLLPLLLQAANRLTGLQYGTRAVSPANTIYHLSVAGA